MSAAKKIPAGGLVSNDFEEIPLAQSTYQKFADYMYEIAGVNLPYSSKNYALVRNRIVKILRKNGFADYDQYWNYLKNGNAAVRDEFVSALTTNMTSFYRESAHFDFFREKLPELCKKNPELRVWCAAASTGQEPYTIAMTIQEALTEAQVRQVKMLATDIDLEVLKKATRGVYDERNSQGLPASHRKRFFTVVKNEGEELLRVNDDLHDMIRFAPFNLMNPTYDFQHKFHVIFCRNVLIYFDEETKKRVINNLVSCLAPGGYLILGHSESGNVKHAQIKPLSRAIYEKI